MHALNPVPAALPMRILPVIDLMAGRVVRGIAGRRQEYRPIISKLTTSTDPLVIADVFRTRFGFDALYLADLDAISGRPPSLTLYETLIQAGFQLWVDAGLRTAPDAVPLLERGVVGIVAGLETLAGPDALAEMLARVAANHLVFSLDLRGGQPLGDAAAWRETEPFRLAEQVIALGVQRLLILDLAQVGVGAGVGTRDLCRRLRARFPRLELAAGGGVRGPDDVLDLQAAGVDWLLVASALHDGRLDPAAAKPSRDAR